jgi:toxin ParE1/3/4
VTLPVVLRPEAQADLLGTRQWYERQRTGLGDAFAEAAEQMIVRIQAMPELYEAVLQGVRRGKLKRFPYVLYYRVLDDRIEVLAVLHGSRSPQVWQDRV